MQEFQNQDRVSTTGTKRSLTEQGYLLIKDCQLATAGTLQYAARNFQPRAFNDRRPDELITVYRSKATIDAAAPAFSGAPVTEDHPTEMLDNSNTSTYQKGHVNGDVTVTDGVMVADILVTAKGSIGNINGGKCELSNGYYSQYKFESGVSPEGEAFDCEQHSIRANHVAIVMRGRNGSECRVSDSSDDLLNLDIEEDKPMATVTINGVSYEASEQVAQAVGILHANLDKAEQAVANLGQATQDAVEVSKKEMQATIDTKQGEIDALKGQIMTTDQMNEAVAARSALTVTATKLHAKGDFTGLDSAGIQSAVVLHCCDDVKTLDGKSLEYVQARFDVLAATVDTAEKKPSTKTLDSALGDATLDVEEKTKLETKTADGIAARQARFKAGGSK